MQINAPGVGVFTLPRQEKLGIWPQTYTTYTYDLSFGLTATQLTSLYNPLTWAASRTALTFAAGFRLSSAQKNSFSWGLDSVLVTFTYTLPSITPYPINGYFQTGYHALVSKPVTINPYSMKSIETVNLQIPPPGTRIAANKNILPYGQVTQEILGRHTLNPGNVDIRNFPIITIEKLGLNRITSLVNLQDRSIKSLENLGLHRLYAQSYINPYSLNTNEQIGFDTLYSQAFIQPHGIKSLDVLGRNTLYSQAFINPYSQISDEKLGLNRLYSQAYIYPSSISENEKLGLHTLYSQAFIIPYPVKTVEKTGLHRLNSEAFIRPYPITTEEKLRLHSLLYGSYIYPYSITNTEILGLHELQRQVRTLSFLNEVHYPSYEMGYFDCVAISRDINNDPYYDMSFGSLNTDYMFSINNMNLFNEKEQLTRYNEIHEICDYFIEHRLKYYDIRKSYLINVLEKQIEVLKNKFTYITELLKGTIDLRKKTLPIINELLESKKYMKIDETYNYLIKMTMDSVCEENVATLKKEYDDKLKELDDIKNTSIQTMWLKELSHLEKFL
jgi:hypothetical protein